MTEAVDAYLFALPRDQHDALQALRATLRVLLPDHLEVISYAMPGFRQPGINGQMVAGYAAFRRNLGFYPHSGRIIGQFPAETVAYKSSKGGVLFTPGHPLPVSLIEKLVAARLAEIAAK